ncbi:MAG: peptide chain release factor 2 [Gemmatimonadales bacterium]
MIDSGLRSRLDDADRRLAELRGYLDVDTRSASLTQLEGEMAQPGFWDKPDQARSTVEKIKTLKGWTQPWHDLRRRLDHALELADLLAGEDDAGMEKELTQEGAEIDRLVEVLSVKALMHEPEDHLGAIITIHPGAGGTESQDWAEMLMRMYRRWGERHGYPVEVLDLMPGEEAGLKSVTMEFRGDYACGWLKSEKGVHRLVRISPFDSQARRHTSFASVFVYPLVDDTIEIELRDEDIRMDVYRASGAGGQHVNKTSSAVRLTHEPTGIVVACQQERSQGKNKNTAMKMLKAALYQRALDEQQKKRDAIEATKTDNSFGNQIRSYVFQPYTMVKDERTGLKLTDVQKVMDGDLDAFIEAFLKVQAEAANKRGAAKAAKTAKAPTAATK